MNKLIFLLIPILFITISLPAPADNAPSWPEIYYHGSTSGKTAALTFDDAPMDGLSELLDILDDLDVRATFFVEGEFIGYRPGMLTEIVLRGHELGNHSFSHPDMTTLDNKSIIDELVSTNQLIYEETGIVAHLFRPPGGARDDRLDRIVYEYEMTSVMWTVNTADYRVDADEIKRRIYSGITPGGIILMHDGVAATREALPEIVEELRSRGYTFVTVGEMLEVTHGECSWTGEDYETSVRGGAHF